MKERAGLAVLLMLGLSGVVEAEVTIVKDGHPLSAIYADPAVMSETAAVNINPAQAEVEKRRVRLRESVKDLAGILERISGAKVPC